MRISDWSSDVCSSDLLLFAWGESVAGPSRPIAATVAGGRVKRRQNACRLPGAERILLASARQANDKQRSEERRVGKEGVRTCRSQWPLYHKKKKKNQTAK